MTAYAVFMDSIIDMPKDVKVLVRHGIIENMLGTDEDVATLFNNISKGTSLDYKKQYLVGLFKQVNAYCDPDRHRWRAVLVERGRRRAAGDARRYSCLGHAAVYSVMSYKKD